MDSLILILNLSLKLFRKKQAYLIWIKKLYPVRDVELQIILALKKFDQQL